MADGRFSKFVGGIVVVPDLDFDKGDGLVPVIAQDNRTNEVLMLAYMNYDAWRLTLQTGMAHYYSRRRKMAWMKGETSRHVQLLRQVLVDCDKDTIVLKVDQVGKGACHDGYRSCFYRHLILSEWQFCMDRAFDPEIVYHQSQESEEVK